MSQTVTVFDRLVRELGYADAGGIVRCTETPASGPRAMLVYRLRRRLPEIQAVYFADDDPLIYFSQQTRFEPRDLAMIHRKVWNDSRVPLLFAIDESHVRIYNAWAEPVRHDDEDIDDSTKRLIRRLKANVIGLKNLSEFHRIRLDTGAYVADLPRRFDPSSRCDQTLLTNLDETYGRLVGGTHSLPPEVAHRLLFRSILLLHLEHRGRLGASVYGQYVQGARTLADVYVDRDAAFRLFMRTAKKFNGDLLPVDAAEEVIESVHLNRLRRYLLGKEELKSGQFALWPLYDFSVIPIQLISSLWERLIHLGDPEKARKTGAYYTPFSLVEMMLNEVLPWPKLGDKPMKQLPKVIDPACGSGVFLVEAFRRLAAHRRHSKGGSHLSSKEIEDILISHIHGIDSEESGLAVKVAAFSLYLALLDELDTEEPLHFPKLTASRGDNPPNLIQSDAFNQHEVAPREFDVVVGNPPWKRARLPESIQRYCAQHGHPVAGEISHAFLWLAGDMAPQGQVTMLAPSKWLFNREGPDAKFRREFFRQNHVEAVINLSALVSGTNRLFNANAPATAVLFRRELPPVPSPSILYCAPRPNPRPGLPSTLVIDAADIKWLPREEAEKRDDIWKAMYVGNWRDLRLLRRLCSDRQPLQAYIDQLRSSEWRAARGFQPDGGKTIDNDNVAARIAEIPFIKADAVRRWSTTIEPESAPWPGSSFKRTGLGAIYEAPHVLVKEGTTGGRLWAAFVVQPCSFRDTITGIHGPESDTFLLKAITGFLNSSLAAYLAFMTTGWGIDRRRVKRSEVLALPSRVLRDKTTASRLANLFDALVSSQGNERAEIEGEIDKIVLDSFGVSAGERILIRDMLATAVDYVHKGAKSEGLRKPTPADLEQYAHSFTSVFGQIVDRSGHSVSWTVYEGDAPLSVVSFTLSSSNRGSRKVSNRKIVDVLRELDAQLWNREGSNLYRRRHVRVYEDRAVHIVKPAELRFWTQSAAFHDADEVLAQSLAGDDHGLA